MKRYILLRIWEACERAKCAYHVGMNSPIRKIGRWAIIALNE